MTSSPGSFKSLANSGGNLHGAIAPASLAGWSSSPPRLMDTTDEEEQAITVRKLDPTTHLALKHDQLTSERGILSLKSADRPERRNQQPQKEEEQRGHRGRRYVIPLQRTKFLAHTRLHSRR